MNNLLKGGQKINRYSNTPQKKMGGVLRAVALDGVVGRRGVDFYGYAGFGGV